MDKYFMYDFEIKDRKLVTRLVKSEYFLLADEKEDLYGNKYHHYSFVGYRQPLLCLVTDIMSIVYSPYDYMGNYDYKGEDTITLHSTYGRMNTYRKIELFGIPFMVDSRLSDDDILLAVLTDDSFVKSLIKAL